MKRIIVAGLIGIGVLVFLIFVSRNNTQTTDQNYNIQASENQGKEQIQPSEKIEVIHFHGTQQCWSCIKVGEYALETIKDKFPKEYADGKIIYKDVNVDSPENRDIVIKYQARGSSLFINAIRNDSNNIEQDFTVWRLVSNEKQFIQYFQNKLNHVLGK